jgi:hypothetical protein
MKKHKIDKLFAEKLKDHKTPPAERVWETLAEELGETPRRQTGVWWKVAAVVLLCLSVGFWVYQGQRVDDNKNLMVQQESTSIEQPTQSEQATEVAEEKTEEVPSLPISPGENEPSQLAVQQDVPAATKKQEKQNVQETSASSVAEQPVRSVERLETVATLSVEEDEVAVENNDFPDEVAVTKVVAEVRAPVTIIYKADAAPKNQEEEKDNKFFEIVKEIKNGDLGLAELREAKSELFASAISRLKDKREKQ